MGKSESEQRRGARFEAELWTGFFGVDDKAVLRHVNLSQSGCCVELDRAVGSTGSLQRIFFAGSDGNHKFEVMCRVVRSLVEDDVRGKTVYHVAVEFTPSGLAARNELKRAVLGIWEHHSLRATPVQVEHTYEADLIDVDFSDDDVLALSSPPLSVSPESAVSNATPPLERKPVPPERKPAPAQLVEFSVQQLLLLTDWHASSGDVLNVNIALADGKENVAFRGEVTRVEQAPSGADGGFRVHVKCQDEAPEVAGVAPQMRQLFANSVAASAERRAQSGAHDGSNSADAHPHGDLTGVISRVRLPSLLAFVEMERMTGELRVRTAGHNSTVYVSDRMIVDVESSLVAETPLDLLGELLNLSEGDFEFTVTPVERPCVIGTTITGTLMEVARLQDEAEA